MRSLCAIALCLLLAGCGQRSVEERNPAPSSSLSHDEAMRWAAAHWDDAAMGRTHCAVLPSGSMVPVFDSKSVLLLEPAGTLRLNDIVIYDSANYSHRVRDLRDGFALIDGDNNQGSDGWVAVGRIHHRVAGILHTKG